MARAKRSAIAGGYLRAFKAPAASRLLSATDHGEARTIPSELFAPLQRGGGWGSFAEKFIRLNQHACDGLDVQMEIGAGSEGAVVRLVPGGRTGAIPLRSAQTGQVACGFVVRPRFGWAGVGQVLSETGWAAAPEFLELPYVPGSGREVPPWVMAGPVLTRLAALLRTMRRGYQEVEQTVQRPRGRILWKDYISKSLIRGTWEKLPCRFSELDIDPRLRAEIRWTLERLHRSLVAVGGKDPIAVGLASLAAFLIELLGNIEPRQPTANALNRILSSHRLLGESLRRGLQAIAWVVEERGLGGGQEQDGLAWSLSLEKLWEAYVESVVRSEAALFGGEVKVARLRETAFPLNWSDPTHRTLGHLAPDVVVRHRDIVWIVDAKYKAHLAELDESGWRRFEEETREAHRADLHQVLAYASLYDAKEIRASLVYPLRHSTWKALRDRKRDVSRAELMHGGRRLTLELRGMPFGNQNSTSRG